MKRKKLPKAIRIILIIILCITAGIFYIMPLTQSEIPLKEKMILYKYDGLSASGYKWDDGYSIHLGLKDEASRERGGEVDAAFEMIMFLEQDKEYFENFKNILVTYQKNGLLVLPEVPSFFIEKEEYEETKLALEEKKMTITPENMADYWRDINYFNRTDVQVEKERDFLYSMLTRWTYVVRYPDESVLRDVEIAMSEKGAGIEAVMEVRIRKFKIEEDTNKISRSYDLIFGVTKKGTKDFIGAMMDNDKNLWIFQRSNLEIYYYLGDNIWSEEPTDKLPDKSVIPPDIVKAYKYIYNKEI